jgi:hypothetical protein
MVSLILSTSPSPIQDRFIITSSAPVIPRIVNMTRLASPESQGLTNLEGQNFIPMNMVRSTPS